MKVDEMDGSPWSVGEGALRAKRGVKWTEFGPMVIPAWIAEMDFPVAPAVRTVLEGSLAKNDLGYPAGADYDAVREGFARRYAKKYSCEIDPGDVEILPDVMQGLYLSVQTLTDPGDVVAVLTPIYPPFIRAVEELGRRVASIPLVDGLGSSGGYGVDVAVVESAFRDEGAKLLLLCNPHNPTGRAFTENELESLGDMAIRYGATIASDEIHADLVLGTDCHTSILRCSDAVRAVSLVLYSASKSFAIPGVACGVVGFGSPEMRRRFRTVPEHLRGAPGALALRATAAAWESGEEWLEQACDVLLQNRKEIGNRLARCPGLRVVPQDATFLSWIDAREASLKPNPAEWILSEARVAVSPGADFGASSAEYFRLNFGTSPVVLREMLDRIIAAWP